MDNDKLIYNDVDITADVNVIAATHEMFAGPKRADTIQLVMDDDSGHWSHWKPMAGDRLSYFNSQGKTGLMYVHEPQYFSNTCYIYATSMPLSAKENTSKTWQQVYLKQIGAEIAGRMGLTYQQIGFGDIYYDRIQQNNEPDISFLYKRIVLEGGSIAIFDGTLVAFKSSFLESMSPTVLLDTEGSTVEVSDKSGSMYGSCMLTSGTYKGRFYVSSGRVYKNKEAIQCTSNAELTRYAAGILRRENENKVAVKLDTFIRDDISAGIMATLEHDAAPSWNGSYYIYQIRNEYHNNKSVIYLRKPLEGY